MKAPVIDLHRPNRPGAAVGLLALVVGIVALIAAMQYRDALKEQGEALDEREATIAKQEAKFHVISNAHRESGDARMAQLMAQQRYATEPARDLIEGGWHPNIALLSLDFVTASRQINMQFETRSVQEAISYADWLQAQPGAESVAIKRQIQKPGPPAPSVETSLQVTWKAFVARPVAASAVAAAASALTASAAASAASTAASAASTASAAPAASQARPQASHAAHPSGARR
ncbi:MULTISPECIES: hypothetical protein [Caballeronia]|uniref:hypothetical protein n=1 Tax=Caballeronia TaxID=1827195 RepID=UPI00025BA8AC|nr:MULTISPECIES: hypothetical protein [Caballeronia]EKS68467.1 hypothetical protein BURK_025595 [Burkholderia sp. SJ98]